MIPAALERADRDLDALDPAGTFAGRALGVVARVGSVQAADSWLDELAGAERISGVAYRERVPTVQAVAAPVAPVASVDDGVITSARATPLPVARAADVEETFEVVDDDSETTMIMDVKSLLRSMPPPTQAAPAAPAVQSAEPDISLDELFDDDDAPIVEVAAAPVPAEVVARRPVEHEAVERATLELDDDELAALDSLEIVLDD